MVGEERNPDSSHLWMGHQGVQGSFCECAQVKTSRQGGCSPGLICVIFLDISFPLNPLTGAPGLGFPLLVPL